MKIRAHQPLSLPARATSAACSRHWPQLTAAALALLASCQEPATTIRVTVTFAPGLALDQLELEATPAGGEPMQARVPDPPAALESGTRVALLVPDAWNGLETKIAVTGTASGSWAAEGEVSAEPIQGQVVDASVALEAACRDECPLADMGCMGQAVSLCQKNAAGCASWGTPVPCPNDKPFCSSGKCDVVCHDECTSGQKRCSGTAGYQVCEVGSAGCLAWTTIVYCEAQQICQAGACQADLCGAVVCDKPPASSCLSSTTLRTYAAPGTCASGLCSYAPSDKICANGCANGACVGDDPCKGMSCQANATCKAGVCVCNQVSCGTACCAPGEGCNQGKCGAQTEIMVVAADGSFSGTLGDLSGADAKCQGQATAAGVSGTWKALVCGTAWYGLPADRNAVDFFSGAQALLPVVNKNGQVLYANWTAMFGCGDGYQGSPAWNSGVSLYSFSGVVASSWAWTGCSCDGSALDDNCCNWNGCALGEGSASFASWSNRELVFYYGQTYTTYPCTGTLSLACVRISP